MGIRVLLADDSRLVREALRHLLEQQPEIQIIAEVNDGPGAVRVALNEVPDVTLMDLAMPGLSGLQATRLMLAEEPGLRVLAMSLHVDRQVIQASLEAGALGYLVKDGAGRELVPAVNTVAKGQYFLCQQAAVALATKPVQPGGASDPEAPLNESERELLQSLAIGRSSDEAAAHLGLSNGVLRARLRRIVEKLAHVAADTGHVAAPSRIELSR